MIEKRGVVGPRAERRQARLETWRPCRSRLDRRPLRPRRSLPALPSRRRPIRRASDPARRARLAARAASSDGTPFSPEVRSGHRDIAIEIGDRVLLQIGGVLLRPLRRSDEAVLLGVPAGNQDRPLRRPAALQRGAKPRATSSIAAVPEFGSTAPCVQASRWLPSTTSFSGSTLPLIVATTL